MTLRLKDYAAKMAPALSLGVGMLSRASGQIVALVITLVAARYLSPTDFGIYAMAAAIVTIVRTLLYSATFQYVMQTPELERYSTECLGVSLLMTLVCSVLPLAVLLAWPNLFGSSGVLLLFLWMAPSNLIGTLTAWSEAQVLRSGKVSRYYGATAITEVLSGAVAVVLFMAGFGVMSFVPMVYVRAVALLGAYGWIHRPALSKGFSLRRFFEVARWSLPQYASSLIGLFSNYGADFMIGAILNPAATGLYRAGSRITSAVSDLCIQPVRLIATTVFARRRAAGGTAADLWPAVAALSLFIALPALGGLAAVADLILPPLLGPDWANLATMVLVLSIGRILGSMGGVASPFLVAQGHHKLLLPIQLFSATCLLLGMLFFAKFGVLAIATVTAASASLGAAISIVMAYRVARSPVKASIGLLLLASLPGALSAVAAAAVARSALVEDPLLLSTIAIATAVLIWLVTLVMLRQRLGPLIQSLRPDSTPMSS